MRQPLLSTENLALAAPTQVWSAQDGSMTAPSHGVFHGDWRYVSGIELRVDGLLVEPLAAADEDGGTVFRALALDPSTRRARTRVTVEQLRHAHSGGMVERATIINGGDDPIDVLVELACRIELAPTASVEAGAPDAADITLDLFDDEAIATDGVRSVSVRSDGGSVRLEGHRVVVSQRARIAPEDWLGITLELEIDDPSLAFHGATGTHLDEPLPTGRVALDRWAERATIDLEHLLLDAGHGPFPAASAPWHMTLVARDALIASRLLLPLGTEVAEGTLRTLAARQGVQLDASTREEPGRILHEIRQGATEAPRPGVEPPPVFAGSVDATPLWVALLHDAWRAGLPLEVVRELRTALHAALGWMRSHTRDGLLISPDEQCLGVTGKDAHDDDCQRLDGSRSGIAMAQVQGLACRAAVGAADLLDALGDDGEPWRAWAEEMRERFRASYWVTVAEDRFPAMALDADGIPVPTLVSDIGHLIGTTLLDAAEEAEVAQLLLDERLSSGFGLRTMATDAEQYWPLAHHCGSVWPHDTAIAIEGLLRAGLVDVAAQLAAQLERAADAFDGRVPEVYAGYGTDETEIPIPLPGARAPQAWAAASVVPVLRAVIEAEAARAPMAERHLAAVATLSRRGNGMDSDTDGAGSESASSGPEPIEINAGARGSATSRQHPHLHLVPPLPLPQG
ncbi:glycogen debranching N-terminal domain-containing protein [Agrococcus sp. Marseille-P2731]|uniref:glycogen debranching N-terminal domain-containing protein n=1 Tax=Agrococcus sp. Marseille-P2731 TaxID=1841862 RepID=UPI0009317CEB|nr:glycogen debranching N-terminal domain-containing protein [Agrococcus sp. Marseille-P2731]